MTNAALTFDKNKPNLKRRILFKAKAGMKIGLFVAYDI
jgi:hypothetical protein